MLEFIKLSLVCVMIDAGGPESDLDETSFYLEQIFLFEDRYSQKKAKVTSYFAEFRDALGNSINELKPWELDYENTAFYTTTNKGMIAFSIPYNFISEDEDQSEFEEDIVLNYFINPETLKIRQTVIQEDLDPVVISGSCVKQKQR